MIASLVITAGLALVAAAFVGGARWLVLPALAIALPLAFVTAAGIDLDGGFGSKRVRPGTLAEVKDTYRLGAGELVLDLRDVKLPAGDRRLKLEIGVGHALVLVPDDVCVASKASIGMGGVAVFERDGGGVDVDWNDARRAGRRHGAADRRRRHRPRPARGAPQRRGSDDLGPAGTSERDDGGERNAACATGRRAAVRRTGSPDRLSLTAGIVLVVFGTVLLLDSLGTLRLDFGSMAPIAFGAVGAVLLASGLSRRGASAMMPGMAATPGGATTVTRELRRDTDNGMVAGVCAGLGRRLQVDPLLLRIAFAATTLASGIGLVAYVLAWILLPADKAAQAASSIRGLGPSRDGRGRARRRLLAAGGAARLPRAGAAVLGRADLAADARRRRWRADLAPRERLDERGRPPALRRAPR